MRTLKLLFLLVLLVIGLVLSSGAGYASTLVVCSPEAWVSGCMYTYISQAMTNAASGDTIKVYPGIYQEDVAIDRLLYSIEGEGDPKDIIVDGGGGAHVIRYKRDTRAKISNLTIKNADVGVQLGVANNVVLQNNIITGNKYGINTTTAQNTSYLQNNFVDNYADVLLDGNPIKFFHQTDWSGGPSVGSVTNLSYGWDKFNDSVGIKIRTGAITLGIMKWGSYGSGDGQFSYPIGIAVDAVGNVYVADHSNHRVQKFDSSGNFITKWGSLGSLDGQFDRPAGIAVDAGNVYVADQRNHRVQKFDSGGNFITKWGSYGSGDGQFNRPRGIAVDAGNVYVADTDNHRVQNIQKFNRNGTLTSSIFDSGFENTQWGNVSWGATTFSGLKFKGNLKDKDGNPIKAFNAATGEVRSAPATADLDRDGDYDLIVGFYPGPLDYYENTGNSLNPIWTYRGPLSDVFGNIISRQQSVPALADIDGDNDYDLVVGTWEGGGAGGLYYYENTGDDINPAWTSRGDVIDSNGNPIRFPEASPFFSDIDNDSDHDLFVGHYSHPTAWVYFYENTGSATSPVWTPRGTLKDSSGITIGVHRPSKPALADMDYDGDFDLVVGAYNYLHYYENTGTATSPIWTAKGLIEDYNGNTISGTETRPMLVDLNGDSKNDLLIGDFYAQIKYFTNFTAQVTLQTRTSNDTATWSAWSKEFVNPSFEEYVPCGAFTIGMDCTLANWSFYKTHANLRGFRKGWNTDGSYSYRLEQFAQAGPDYIQISQDIDLTDIEKILVDLKAFHTSSSQYSKVFIDGEEVFSVVGVVDEEYKDYEIITSEIGVHTLLFRFGLTSTLGGSGDLGGLYIDNVRTYGPYTNPAGSPIVSPPGQYIQYRAFLSTEDPTVSPILDSVTITYIPPPLPPTIVCEEPWCDAPDPTSSDTGVTFSPVVSENVTGVVKTEICQDSGCGKIFCSNDVYVNPGIAENRSCSWTPGVCELSNYTYWVRAISGVGVEQIIQGGTFAVKKGGGCTCTTSEECLGACLNGVCVTPQAPDVTWDVEEDTVYIQVGTITSTIINLTNPLEVEDTIILHLYGEPEKIKFWSWFVGHRYDEQKADLPLELLPGETRAVAVEIIGGSIGSGKLDVWVESSTTGMRGRDSRKIQIYSAKGLFAGAPGLNWAGFVLVVFISAFFIWRRKI